jgi:hypothetical protein
LSKEGLGTVRHKEVILPEDLQKIIRFFMWHSRIPPKKSVLRVFVLLL